MIKHVDTRLNVYWRVGASKKIAKRYRKGWRPRHVQWDSVGERVIILWERERLVDEHRG